MFKVIIILIVVISIATAAILVYKNNQKKADTIIGDVQKDVTAVKDTVKKI